MAILKCKMCGGDILLSEDKTTGTCDHCGSTMTFPRVSDEQKLNLYNRANHFRRQNEFDKAITAYERILDQDDTDAEAHWGAVLSRYGIEYVEDPVTHERIPTCHRVQLSSILSDGDYLAALENAPDTASRDLYEQEARRIAEIQKGILSISSQEKPYDVFICYKETDDSGSRTKDSTLAQEIYYQLTNEGYKVFFSRITLEDKLGQQYEPYIFAALNSAKVMLVIGTKPEYFNAVWVKNEWSRYLALMKNNRTRLLIPCYRDMDAYDLPDDLSGFQSQDMSKIGFMQDLIRGVKKVLESKKMEETKPAVSQAASSGANIENLMKRAWLFMEDGDFKSTNEYLDKVLDEDAEYAPAYAGKVCTAFGFHKESDLAEATFLYADHPDWKKALRFSAPEQRATYEKYYQQVKVRVEKQIRDYAYDCAIEMAVNPKADREKLNRELEQYKASCAVYGEGRADGSRRRNAQENETLFEQALADSEPGEITEQSYQYVAQMLRAIGGEKANKQAESCLVLAELSRQKAIYWQAEKRTFFQIGANEYERLAEQFLTISNYKDAKQKANNCRVKADTIRKDLYDTAIKAMNEAGTDSWKWKQAQEKLNHSDLDEYRDIPALRQKAEQRYQQCMEAEEQAKRQEAERQAREAVRAKARKKRNIVLVIVFIILAIAAYFVITEYILPKGHYDKGVSLRNAGQWEEAVAEFNQAGEFNDAATQVLATRYAEGEAKLAAQNWDGAVQAFEQAGSYSDAVTQITETWYQQAASLNKAGKYAKAYAVYITIAGYKDVDNIIKTDNSIAREAKLALYKTTGTYVTLGTYPQTSDGTDSTAIEWLVLDYDAKNNRTLLISRYGLDAKQYNEKYEDITWERCTLRTWLNNTFFNKAFSANEQNAIQLTSVNNNDRQGYSGWSTSGGNNTHDKIFLLSYAEANKYFNVTYSDSNNTKSRVQPTAYAIKQGAYTSSSYKTADGAVAGWWWLRSPGSGQDGGADVSCDGSLNYNRANYTSGAVRPAFWLNLDSDYFR